MLEIFAVIALTRYLASVADGKGHTKLWAGLAPLMWIVGECAGGFAGALANLDLDAYALAIVFAITVGALAWGIVTALPDRGVAPEGAGLGICL